MPHLVSEALDYNDFTWQFRAFPLNFPTPVVATSGDPTSLPETIDNDIGGGSVGAGRLYTAALSSRAVLEEITLICTTGGGDGVAIFTVVGGTTGAFTTTTLTAGVRYVSNDVYIYIRTTTDWSATGDPDRIRFTFEQGRSTALVQETELCTFTASTDLIERDDNENWVDHGYSVGGGIFIVDAVDAGNNGFHLIEGITTDALTIDDTHSTIADETADSVTIQPYVGRPANVDLIVDFTNAGDEVFLQGSTDGWNSLNITEGDYIRIENAATSGHNDFWKVIRVFTSGGGTNRDTIQLESGAITADDSDDTVTITGYHIPERWVEDRFREGADEVSMTAPPTEDGNGDFNTQWEFHAPGISGTEAIYGSTQTVFNNTNATFNLRMRVANSFLRSNGHGTHPGSSTNDVYLLLNRAPLQFYASYNGDAQWGFVKAAGSIDEPFYIGVIARHGTTLQLPYPVFVGGAAGVDIATGGGAQLDDSETTSLHSAFWRAGMSTVGGGGPDFPTSKAWFQRKDGAYGNIVHGTGTVISGRNNGNSMNGVPMFDGWITPFHNDNVNADTSTAFFDGQSVGQALSRSGFGDVFERVPMELHDESNVYGELHGLFAISGQGDAANITENFMIENGVRFVVMQNTFRSGRNDYIAMRMEP